MVAYEIILRHGGVFKLDRESKTMEYVGAKIDILENIDSDRFKIEELEKHVQQMGYTLGVFYYKEPGKSLFDGINVAISNFEIEEMYKVSGGVAEVYFEDKRVDDNEPYPKPEVEIKSDPQTIVEIKSDPQTIVEIEHDPQTEVESEDYDSAVDICDDEIEECSDKELKLIKKNRRQGVGTSVRQTPMRATVKATIQRGNNVVYENEENDGDESSDGDEDNSEPNSDYESEKEDVAYYGRIVEKKKEGAKGVRFQMPMTKKNVNFQLLMRFDTREQVKEAVQTYAVENRYDLKFVRNEKAQLVAVCMNHEDCPWRLYVSLNKANGEYQVKSYNNKHKCGKIFKNRKITARWIANEYGDRIRELPSWKVRSMKKEILKDWEANVSTDKCIRARQIALGQLSRSMEEHYARLWDYKAELEKRNPGSTIELEYQQQRIDQAKYFYRMYICFDALKRGFLSNCRKVLCVDGCFLKGIQKGQLLSAVARDGNNQMYPVAWAVVPVEDTNNWRWFLNLLQADLEFGQGEKFTFISDKCKGLEAAIKDVVPYAYHRRCARHVFANWRKKFGGGHFRVLFWSIAKACTTDELKKGLLKLKQVDIDAHDDLVKRDPKEWCRAYFDTHSKVINVESNLAEAFNWSIIESRTLPIIYMLEEIRRQVMERIKVRRQWITKKKTFICPAIMKKIERYKQTVRMFQVGCTGDALFEVKFKQDAFIVDTEGRTCSCRRWDLSGIPCVHALCCIYLCGKDVDDFVDECYYRKSLIATYSHQLLPITGENQWELTEKDPLFPSPAKRVPGKMQTKRRREEWEKSKGKKKNPNVASRKGSVMTCRRCNDKGHNARGCPKKNELPDPPRRLKKTKTTLGENSGRVYKKSRKQVVQNDGPDGEQVVDGTDGLHGENGAQAKSKEVLNDFETEILFSQVDGIVAAHNVTQSSVIQSGGSSQVSEVNEVPCLITTKYSRA